MAGGASARGGPRARPAALGVKKGAEKDRNKGEENLQGQPKDDPVGGFAVNREQHTPPWRTRVPRQPDAVDGAGYRLGGQYRTPPWHLAAKSARIQGTKNRKHAPKKRTSSARGQATYQSTKWYLRREPPRAEDVCRAKSVRRGGSSTDNKRKERSVSHAAHGQQDAR